MVFYLTLRVRHTLTWWSLGGAGSMYAVYLVYVLALAALGERGARHGAAAGPPRPTSYLATTMSTVEPIGSHGAGVGHHLDHGARPAARWPSP